MNIDFATLGGTATSVAGAMILACMRPFSLYAYDRGKLSEATK